jgi:hypothetical protein
VEQVVEVVVLEQDAYKFVEVQHIQLRLELEVQLVELDWSPGEVTQGCSSSFQLYFISWRWWWSRWNRIW